MDGSHCCTPITSGPLYLQLIGPGAIWIMLHCGGMCGPLVAGLGLGTGNWRSSMMRLGLYQLGRVLPLSAAGALAGSVGGTVAEYMTNWGPWSVIVLAGLLYLAVIHRLGWIPWPHSNNTDGNIATRLMRPLAAWGAHHPYMSDFAFGLVLSTLPCGIVFSTLGLAVASASPWHGAVLMTLLVAISTVPLAIVIGTSSAAFSRMRQQFAWLPTVALLLSATLLLLHGLAGIAVIPHLHLWRIMLW